MALYIWFLNQLEGTIPGTILCTAQLLSYAYSKTSLPFPGIIF
jgi:hypothetical protein